ncbi:FkbM family methyltransferase [Parasedimentitalea huanghaiensis]|uniref:FkbM family methyltransferase n=1 Tax=Parasedimentitalea huanghaiensis TaxID=2682100 RepID=A0A6L6WNY6_9RHOB|nr:FkbM family methyltransferase [Zongyanglinia huanghaiensis]MVO17332.1 FkbM family methyltransferase [Zongyanglinia huanghaiensis]
MHLNSTKFVSCRGVRIPLDEKIITPKVEKKLQAEFYETPEVIGLPKFIQKQDRVLELGSGIGFISTYLAKVLGVSHVTCVEANPHLCEFISHVHAANGVSTANVRNVLALSDDAELPADNTVPFYVTDPFWSSSLNRPSKASYNTIDVPVVRLSKIIAEVKPSVIVCDIEGGEVDLFENVELAGVSRIYMELHTRKCGGSGIIKVFESMHRHGFFYHQRVSSEGAVLFQKL